MAFADLLKQEYSFSIKIISMNFMRWIRVKVCNKQYVNPGWNFLLTDFNVNFLFFFFVKLFLNKFYIINECPVPALQSQPFTNSIETHFRPSMKKNKKITIKIAHPQETILIVVHSNIRSIQCNKINISIPPSKKRRRSDNQFVYFNNIVILTLQSVIHI